MPNYLFRKLYLNNFFVFSSTIVPLDSQGLVIVKGKYGNIKDTNAAGKSLLFSSLSMLAQGILPTGNVSAKEKTKIDISLMFHLESSNTNRYDISLKKGSYEIIKSGKHITPHRKPEAMKLIKSIFPEEEILNSASFISQFSPLYLNLISGSPGIRAKVLYSLLDQSKVKELQKVLTSKTEKIKKVSNQIEVIKTRKTILTENLEDLPKVNSSIKPLVKKSLLLKKSLSKNRKQLAEEKASHKRYKKYKSLKNKLKIKDYKKASIELKKSSDYLKILKKNLSVLQEAYGAIELYLKLGKPNIDLSDIDLPKLVRANIKKGRIPTKKKIKYCVKNYEHLLELINFNWKTSNKLSDLKGKKKCPTCLKSISTIELKDTIEKLRKEIKVAEKNQKKYIPVLETAKTLFFIQETFATHGVKEKHIKTCKNIHKMEKEVEKLEERIIFLEKQLPVLKAIRELGDFKLNNLSILKKLKTIINKQEALLENISDKITNIEYSSKRRKVILKKKKDLLKKEKKLEGKISQGSNYVPILLKATNSRDFKTEILMGFCDMLVSDWNIYAQDIFNRQVNFSLGIDRGYPSFFFSYGKNGYKYDIRHLSGAEKKRLTATMIPSILKVVPSPTNILVVDELDANVSTLGTESLLDFFPVILESDLGKTSIFFITARHDLQHQEYSNWLVERTGNTSKLLRE